MLSGFACPKKRALTALGHSFHMAKAAPRKGQKASASTGGKKASKTTASRKSGKPAAMMGLTELVIPPKADGYASRRELSEAVDAALDAPLPAHAVEMFKLVRERFPRETDAWLSIYSGGMPWIDMPATEPLKTMDEIARMSVRDFYVDQCCDAVVVTEVTEDTVTALCDYGS